MKRFVPLVLVAAGLAACGGGSGGGVVPPDGGNPGGGSSGSCQQDFTPERVAAGENCDPALNRARFCSLVPGSEYVRSRGEVIPCEGVEISEHAVSGGGFEAGYLAIRRSGVEPPAAVYLALHYLGASADYFANLIRLTELAKARNALVLVPQAPGVSAQIPLIGGLPQMEGSLLSRWPTDPSQPVESYLQLLDAVVDDGRSRFSAASAPLYAAGLSNGVPMVYFYACGRADRVDAVLAVAGNQNSQAAAACAPSAPVGLVILHGSLDPIVPYGGIGGLLRTIPENYAAFRELNQCSATALGATLNAAGGGSVTFDWAPDCAGGRRVVLGTQVGNGHNWPGDDAGLLQEQGFSLGLFGPARDDIDATLQGFDLLRYAAGH